MKSWKGKWIIAVAALHTAFAVISFNSQYQEIISLGVFNSIASADTGLAVWFFLFGAALFLVGQLVMSLEKSNLPIPKSIGSSLLAITILGAILMPKSGFWLVLPAAIAMILDKRQPLEST